MLIKNFMSMIRGGNCEKIGSDEEEKKLSPMHPYKI
jgi:hypothetical protein